MGRYYFDKKTEANPLKKLEISWIKKQGYLKPNSMTSTTVTWTHGMSGKKSSISMSVINQGTNPHVQLQYTQTEENGDKKDFDYNIQLVTTPCHYGGDRYWFICPLTINGKYCGRRVGVVYKAGDYFGCRHCYNLSYESRNESRSNRFYPLFQILGGSKKIEELEEKIKRPFYNGKPTRKQRQVEKYYARRAQYIPMVKDF